MAASIFNDRIKKEFEYLNFPEKPWVEPSKNQYDVVVIGAGMAGLAAAFALKRLGISKIKIFDMAKEGYEGPWVTCARMPTLRSGKDLVGPALDFPLLTFQAWFVANFSQAEWNQLGKIPTALWMDYLRSLRVTLNLEIENGTTLKSILPYEEGLILTLDEKQITTRKVILATGRGGFGGSSLPKFAEQIPCDYYSHTNDQIDFSHLQNKRVAVIGGGASGFDAAAAALEAGSLHVDIILRRQALPFVNKAASLTYSGYFEGYYLLKDERRWKFLAASYQDGIPPPYESVERIISNPRFSFVRGVEIQGAKESSAKILLETSQESLTYDYLIFATGFKIDISTVPELEFFADKIALWSDRESVQGLSGPNWFHRSPYLGPHFQFLEKIQGEAPHLKDIYCFNYAATLSQGQVAGDIPGIGVGAMRLARGIASDFFEEGFDDYYKRLVDFKTTELSPNLR